MERDLKGLQQSAFHDFKNNKSVKDCFLSLGITFGDAAPTIRTVQRWYADFRKGKTSVGRRPASGRPTSAVTKQNIAAVNRLVSEDPHITYEEIEHHLGIGSAATKTILHEKLSLRKL